MKRALTVGNIIDKKYKTFDLEGRWNDFLGKPERSGVWFIWGNSGNGKTSFVMQLCKELCKYDKVCFDSLEEGTSLTMQNSLKRFGMMEVSRKMHFVVEGTAALTERLNRNKSFNIVVIDSFQYLHMSYREYQQLKERFPDKLIIFISHARGKNPAGDAAMRVMYDATEKIWIEGYRAISKGRFLGETGTFSIWPEKEREYWGE